MRRTRALTLAPGCCLAIATSSPPAQAGVYDVWSCALPDGTRAPANGWAPGSDDVVSRQNGYAYATGKSKRVIVRIVGS